MPNQNIYAKASHEGIRYRNRSFEDTAILITAGAAGAARVLSENPAVAASTFKATAGALKIADEPAYGAISKSDPE